MTPPLPPGSTAPSHSRFANACVLAATVSGSSLAIIDATAVNVALPAIQKGFDADITALQWVVESYALLLGALILVGGVLGDHLGRKRLVAIGVLILLGRGHIRWRPGMRAGVGAKREEEEV